MRAYRSSSRLAGIGSSSPSASVPPLRLRASASSSAKNGLPPEVSRILISVGLGNVASRRARRSSWRAPTLRPPRSTVRSSSSGTARVSQAGTSPRTASSVAIGSRSRRASAKRTAASDAASSHWTSSIARQSGPASESSRSAPRRAAATACSSTGSSDSPSSSAPSSARRWIGGSSASTSPAASPRRSPTPANANWVSASEGREVRTR